MNDFESVSQEPIELPMVQPPDPEVLAAEKKWLVSLEDASPLTRWSFFLKRGGPGYLQSALTLGGGTAAATLMAGGAFGYSLLWVAPVSMLLGLAVLSAVAHQTLSTGKRTAAGDPSTRRTVLRLCLHRRCGAVECHLALCSVRARRSRHRRHRRRHRCRNLSLGRGIAGTGVGHHLVLHLRSFPGITETF